MMRRKLLIYLILLLCGYQAVLGQNTKIYGKVTDLAGKPLDGVTVSLDDTNTRLMTNPDGTYAVDAKVGQKIIFSMIGALSETRTILGTGPLNVQLDLNFNLEEVVVTGYQAERKKDLTGAVAVVDVEDMNKQVVANPVKGLQGKVAGVFITGDGSPKAGATVRIRGVGTLNNNDPLYIVDGIPTKSGMHELNPEDIESMQVLKDASSASIYGSRAANGVIVITTKKGKLGATRFNINAYSAISSYNNRVDMLDAQGYGKALWQAYVNNGSDPNNNNVQYKFDWNANSANGTPQLNGIMLPEYLDENKTLKTANTDWFDEISRIGIVQNYDFSVSNGTEKGSYLFSMGYFDNKGVVRTTGFNRLTARINSDFKLLDGRITIGENFSVNKTKEIALDGGVLNLALQSLPVIPVHTMDGLGWGGPIGGMNDRQNPVRILEDNKQNSNHFLRLFGNAFADVKIMEGLSFRTNVGIDYGNYYKRGWRKVYQSGYLQNDVNRLQMDQTHNVRQTWTNTLNYNYASERHRLDVVVGTEYFHEYETTFWASRERFNLEDEDSMYLGAGVGIKDNDGSGNEYALMSYFGKANYAFKDRYLASVTLRYDGSSRFGENNRFGTFPAFSLGWRLSEEAFFKNNTNVFDDLKIRFGWGKTGNQEIANNAIYNIYVTDYSGGDPTWTIPRGTAYDIAGIGSGNLAAGYKLTQNANPDLRWEASTMANIGLDFSLFNQKISGSAEYFVKNTSDILVLPPFIGVLGEGGNKWVNGASMENKGVELSLNHQSEINEHTVLALSANIASYRNKITKLPVDVVNNYGGNGMGDNILGRPINSFYGYVADGLFKTQEEVDAHIEQQGKGLGRIRYRDLDQNGVINNMDRTWIGIPHPDFTYGFNISLKHKGFDFSAFLQGVSGVDVINDFKYNTDFWSVAETGSNKGARLLDAWSPTNPHSDIPMITLVDNNWEGRFSTYFVESGSYLKLRNVQIGYTLAKELLTKLKMQSLRFYVGGDNLGVLLKSKSFTGMDPENPGYAYPNPFVITAGVNISL
jgi:TonB-linked SusC/RagA family outer membrane protein